MLATRGGSDSTDARNHLLRDLGEGDHHPAAAVEKAPLPPRAEAAVKITTRSYSLGATTSVLRRSRGAVGPPSLSDLSLPFVFHVRRPVAGSCINVLGKRFVKWHFRAMAGGDGWIILTPGEWLLGASTVARRGRLTAGAIHPSLVTSSTLIKSRAREHGSGVLLIWH